MSGRQRMLIAILQSDGSRRMVEVTGRRNIETLCRLVANPTGITTLDHWARGVRLSHYIFKLRQYGFDIETIDEEHDGIRYGRYCLRSRVILPDGVAGETEAA